MAVPNIFGTATAAIPLSQLDQNFATAITIGNTAVYLGNTTTSLGNVTLTNVTISSGTSNITTNVATVTGTLPEANGGTGTTTGYYGFKNRIINGAMNNAQYATTSVTPTAAGYYSCDRWRAGMDVASKYSIQQTPSATETGFATRVAAGFVNYLGITSTSAYTVGTNEQFTLQQRIEGNNISDLAWGTSSAISVTLSFWVRSSLTGAFSGSLRNSASNRSYPFSYTISVANTWEQKTITIAGDQSGTWLTTNGIGITLTFCLGGNGTVLGTANAWVAGDYVGVTSTTNIVSTNGATFYITGVQLEKGSTATSFDYRPYGTELALCQRYFYTLGGTNSFELFATGVIQSATNAEFVLTMPVTMRSSPTAAIGGTAGNFFVTNNANFTPSAVSFDIYALNTLRVSATISGATGGNGAYLRANSSLSAKINVTAEL